MKVVLFSYHHVDFLTKLHELLHRTKFILFLFFSWSSRLSFIISFSSLDYHFLRLYLVSDTLFLYFFFLKSILLRLSTSRTFNRLSLLIFLYRSTVSFLPPYILLLLVAVSFPTFLYSAALFLHLSIFPIYDLFPSTYLSSSLSIYLIHLPIFLFPLLFISSIQLALGHLLFMSHI